MARSILHFFFYLSILLTAVAAAPFIEIREESGPPVLLASRDAQVDDELLRGPGENAPAPVNGKPTVWTDGTRCACVNTEEGCGLDEEYCKKQVDAMIGRPSEDEEDDEE